MRTSAIQHQNAKAHPSSPRIRNPGVEDKKFKAARMGGGEPRGKMKKILDKCRCPQCRSEGLRPTGNQVVCRDCKKKYAAGKTWVDFVGSRPQGSIARHALATWGQGLHAKTPREQNHERHFPQFREAFGPGFDFPRGEDVLEMGCGAGGDAVHLSETRPDLQIWGCDLGENIPRLAEQTAQIPNLRFFRADCRHLPVRTGNFGRVVSFGVFHHTSDPAACVRELARVLARNGRAFVYLYKNHEDNPWKRAGVAGETVLMKILAGLPAPVRRAVCRLLTLPCLLLFSWPAQLFKKIPATRKLGASMPLHWGTTPASITGDLEDRLLAPINHRFSREGFTNLFRSAGFRQVRVVTTPFGHYAMVGKKK